MHAHGKPRRAKAVTRKISDELRRRIFSGELAPGTKLPTTKALAEQVGTNVRALHQVLAELVREGLLTRSPRVGTYVATREVGLKRVGIYHAVDLGQYAGRNFLRTLHNEILKLAQASNLSVQVWSDPRPYANQKTALPELTEAALDRSIQGLISLTVDPLHLRWLKTLPVPVTLCASALPNGVEFDYVNFLEVSLKALKDQGCRSVALMTPYYPVNPFGRYPALAERLGLRWQKQWMTRTIENPQFKTPAEMNGIDAEWAGLQNFEEFWKERPRPDGLIVYPDNLAQGALMGMLTAPMRVQVPKDLRVVLHKHAEMDYLCPLPVTYAVSRIRNIAEEMLTQLDLSLKGHEAHPALIKYEIVTPQ